MSNDLPGVGTPVGLRDDDGLYYTSRVEGIEGNDVIAVARPSDLRAAIEYPEGMRLDLTWTSGTGIHVVPTELLGSATENHIRLWNLTVVGEPRVEQRREYVRVPVAGPIMLTPYDADDEDRRTDDELPDPLDATLVDVSEVATQCVVPAPGDDPRVAIGAEFRCQFAVSGRDFDMRGKVIIARQGGTTQQTNVVINFETSPATADALRKQVFAAQLANRRSQS